MIELEIERDELAEVGASGELPIHMFGIRDSEWIGVQDPELYCLRCGRKLCDVEHGDTLDVLIRVCTSHRCLR